MFLKCAGVHYYHINKSITPHHDQDTSFEKKINVLKEFSSYFSDVILNALKLHTITFAPKQQESEGWAADMVESSSHLVDIVDISEAVELGVHGVKHVDDLDGLTGCADVREGDHITEENSAHLKLTWWDTTEEEEMQ